MQFNSNDYVVLSRKESALSVNRVLRKTYLLLSLTILFSAAVALATLAGFLPFVTPGIALVGMFGFMFLTQALRNSKWALLSVFAFTGFMGYALAPTVAYYLMSYGNGVEIVQLSLFGTAVIVLSLSLYTIIRRENFDYLAGFLFVAISVVFLASIASIFLKLALMQVLVSAAFILISSGLILFKTSQLVHGGESNYIMATVDLYVSIFNIFVSLLNVLSFLGGSRRN